MVIMSHGRHTRRKKSSSAKNDLYPKTLFTRDFNYVLIVSSWQLPVTGKIFGCEDLKVF